MENTVAEICRVGPHTYFSEIGSYCGAVKIDGKWVSVKELNYIDKTGWERLQGPPGKKVAEAMDQAPISARILFPSLVK